MRKPVEHGVSDRAFDEAAAVRRLRAEKILSLPDDAILVPGHGPETTIGGEQNPFLAR